MFKRQYNSWRGERVDQFKWGDVSSDQVREYWMKVLYHYRELFDSNPKAPPATKGVECALYFKTPDLVPSYRPPPRLSSDELKYMDKDVITKVP